uniref:PDZ domain-containing protein n=1 Tax=Amphimedon queenslandica TaxID=400682 RepID=A0A1X7SLV6_AMPQE
ELVRAQGLGLSIVGRRGSPTGDVPIYVKRILPESVLQKDSKIKTGDELNLLDIYKIYIIMSFVLIKNKVR